MAGIARPFIPWIGSKKKLIPYIWQVFPPSPKLYLEPFGGGGALLLGMQPKISRMDIYNDFNCDLVNLFCAYRLNAAGHKMQRRLLSGARRSDRRFFGD